MSLTPAQEPEGPSLGELLGALARDTGSLVRDEVRLVRVEMAHKASTIGANAGLVVSGALVIHAGVIALGLALIIGLTVYMPLWCAALLVGVVLAGAGAVIVLKAIAAIKNLDPVPRAAVATLEENKQWLERQAQ